MPKGSISSALAGLSACLALVPACGGSEPPGDGPSPPATREVSDPRAWLERAAQKLRHGPGLGPEDDLLQLASLPREEALDRLLADPRVEDMVFDFNLYFLGYRGVRFRDDAGRIAPPPVFGGAEAFVPPHYPAALASVRAFLAGGDYLVLLDLEQPTFVAPPLVDPSGALLTGISGAFDPQEVLDQAERLLDPEASIGPASGATPGTVASEADRATQFCTAVTQAVVGGPLLLFSFRDLDLVQVLVACGQGKMPDDPRGLVARLRRQVATVVEHLRQFAAEGYVTRVGAPASGPGGPVAPLLGPPIESTLRSFSDFRAVDPEKLELRAATAYGDRFWADNPNSSTNYDRKRAAYVLDRYFCDDLKPIAVPLPEGHGGGAHAASPSCRSCHYKLDPMAGFFKDVGILGVSFREAEEIVFDDGAAAAREDYVAPWRGASRPWEIGYVRSATDDSQNIYGESLEDLHRIIRSAPEVKRCLVQRWFEYLVGVDQAVDPGYLDALAETFSVEAEVNSSAALRSLVKTILLSGSFSTDERRADACYDRAPGVVADDERPPCEVAAILEKSCATCHSGPGALGGLELVRWVPGKEGLHFPHRDAAGEAVPRAESLARILDRLSTSDPARSMPLGRAMRTRDREAVITWISAQLEERGATP